MSDVVPGDREVTVAEAAGPVDVVLKTMSLRPDFVRAMSAACAPHLSDGALAHAEQEMIAAYVSLLTRCNP